MVWKRNEPSEDDSSPRPPASRPQPRSGAAAARDATPAKPPAGKRSGVSTLGSSLEVEGTIRGDEDLRVDGTVHGRVELPGQSVTVGESGRVEADIRADSVTVEGRVQGDLFGSREVVIRAGGDVEGNITAPRVALEDGCKFRGSIDMEPAPGSGSSAAKKSAGREERSSPSSPSSTPSGAPAGSSTTARPASGGSDGQGGKEEAAGGGG